MTSNPVGLPKMKTVTVTEFWQLHAASWQAKLDSGEPLTANERRNFGECMEAWADDGYVQSKRWSLKDIASFKRRWKTQLLAWEKKESGGVPFTLEERKAQQFGLGAWGWIGNQESSPWDKEAWKTFSVSAKRFAARDERIVKSVVMTRSQKSQG